MPKELNSQFKANSFCCTLNNIDKLFDVNDTSFNDENIQMKLENKQKNFETNLEADKKYSPVEMVEHLIYLWVDGKERNSLSSC